MNHSADDFRNEDLFFQEIVSSYVDPRHNPRFLRRDWLADEIDNLLKKSDKRFVLLTAEPGFGKSVFMTQLAHDHPEWLRYFLRRDQREVGSDVSSRSFLLRIGYQLAAQYPELFEKDVLEVAIEQRIGDVQDKGEVVGAIIKKMIASPFFQNVIKVGQYIDTVSGQVTGLHINELVTDPHRIDTEDLQHMALIDPANALLQLRPEQQIVILVDALDEVRYHNTVDNLLAWLTNCPDLPKNIRFVLTSRSPEGAVQLFKEQQARRVEHLVLDREQQSALRSYIEKDIENYVDVLMDDPHVRNQLEQQPEHVNHFRDEAIVKADGNLGYLDAIARGIERALVQNDTHTLSVLLTLESLPENIQGLYAFFLHRIKTDVSREQMKLEDLATGESCYEAIWPAVHYRILGVLAVVREPVSLVMIQNLGGIHADWSYLDRAMETLTQFLDVIGNHYRLYHASLPEFLTSSETRDSHDMKDLYCDPLRWHRQITRRYLSINDQWADCDLYGYRHLPFHLSQSGEFKQLEEILLDYSWLQNKLKATTVNALINDYDLWQDQNTKSELALLQDALLLSANALSADKNQLASQLVGRLNGFAQPALATLFRQAASWQEQPWLKLQRPTLTLPGGTLKATFPLIQNVVNAVAITPDGKRIVSGSEAGIVVWDIENGKDSFPVDLDHAHVTAVTPDGKRIVLGLGNGCVLTWDVEKGEERLPGHSREVTAVAMTPDGKWAVSGSADKTVKVWDVEKCEACFTLDSGYVHGVAVTSDGARVIVAGGSGRLIQIWNVERGKEPEFFTIECYGDAIAATQDGKRIVAIVCDRARMLKGWATVQVWDLEERKLLSTLNSYYPLTVVVTPDSNRVVIGSESGSVEVWDVGSGESFTLRGGHSREVTALAVTPDGKWIVSGSDEDFTIKVWDLTNVVERTTSKSHSRRDKVLAVTSDGKWCVTASVLGWVKVWDLDKNEVCFTVEETYLDNANKVAITPDGKRLVFGSFPSDVKVWDLGSKKCITLKRKWEGPLSNVTAVAMTPNGKHIAAGYADGKVRAWYVANIAKRLITWLARLAPWRFYFLDSYLGGSNATAVTPDGRWVVSGSPNWMIMFELQNVGIHITKTFGKGNPIAMGVGKEMQVWDTKNGKSFWSGDLDDQLSGVNTVTVTPDSKLVFWGDHDGEVMGWDVGNFEEPFTLTEHLDVVNAVAVTLDGKRVVSGSRDKTVKVIDRVTGKTAVFFAEHSITFCDAIDSTHFIAGDAGGNVHFLELVGMY